MKRITLVSVFALVLTGGVMAAQPPDTINYQGVLRNSDDKPVQDGTYSMIFRFFSAETGGDEILIDTHGTVTVSGGLFNVQLGSGSVTDGSGPGEYTTLSRVFANYPDLHLEVEVSGESLSPRIRVVSAGYALNTRYVRGMEIVSEGPMDLYVDAITGDDANDGLKVDTAKKTIQAAVDAVPVVVNGPSYDPHCGRDVSRGGADREATCLEPRCLSRHYLARERGLATERRPRRSRDARRRRYRAGVRRNPRYRGHQLSGRRSSRWTSAT